MGLVGTVFAGVVKMGRVGEHLSARELIRFDLILYFRKQRDCYREHVALALQREEPLLLRRPPR